MTVDTGPTRRCVGCRDRAPKSSLWRFVVSKGVLCWDEGMTMSGRGAYLHPSVRCWSKAGEIALWLRALRCNGGDIDRAQFSTLREQLREVLGQHETPLQDRGASSRIRL